MATEVQSTNAKSHAESKRLFRSLAILFFVLTIACYLSPVPQTATLALFVLALAFEFGFWVSLHRALK